MLLVHPPGALAQRTSSDRTKRLFIDYCDQYEEAVLAQPPEELAAILEGLSEDYRGEDFCSRLQLIVERELNDNGCEPVSKVARLVVLCALANSLSDLGFRIDPYTKQHLDLCWEEIPMYLMLAIAGDGIEEAGTSAAQAGQCA